MDHRYRKFLAVAETLSFSEAAKKLHVTQPAITFALASLERAFGTKLYIRKKYAVELTPEGEIVAASARKIAREVDNMRRELGIETPLSQYKIGIIDSLAYLLYASSERSQLLENVGVTVDSSRHIINEVSMSNIDAGLITGQPNDLGKDITVQKLHGEEFVFVRAPRSDDAAVSEVSQIDDWLAFNHDSTSYKYFTNQFKSAGLKVTPVFYSTSMELLKEMAIAGKGTALLPRHLVGESVANGMLAIMSTRPLNRPIWAITRKGTRPGMISKLSAGLDMLLADIGTSKVT